MENNTGRDKARENADRAVKLLNDRRTTENNRRPAHRSRTASKPKHKPIRSEKE